MLSLFRKGLGQKPGLNRNSVYLEFLLAINILELFRSATGGGSACIQFWVVFIRFSPSLFFQQILPPLHPRPPFFFKKISHFYLSVLKVNLQQKTNPSSLTLTKEAVQGALC